MSNSALGPLKGKNISAVHYNHHGLQIVINEQFFDFSPSCSDFVGILTDFMIDYELEVDDSEAAKKSVISSTNKQNDLDFTFNERHSLSQDGPIYNQKDPLNDAMILDESDELSEEHMWLDIRHKEVITSTDLFRIAASISPSIPNTHEDRMWRIASALKFRCQMVCLTSQSFMTWPALAKVFNIKKPILFRNKVINRIARHLEHQKEAEIDIFNCPAAPPKQRVDLIHPDHHLYAIKKDTLAKQVGMTLKQRVNQLNEELQTDVFTESRLKTIYTDAGVKQKKVEFYGRTLTTRYDQSQLRRQEEASELYKRMNFAVVHGLTLVFVDETSFQFKDCQTSSYMAPGQTIKVGNYQKSDKNVTCFGAVTERGLIYHKLLTGFIDSKHYIELLDELFTVLKQQGIRKIAILFDGASFHTTKACYHRILLHHNAIPILNIAYMPRNNIPIEVTWMRIKSDYRKEYYKMQREYASIDHRPGDPITPFEKRFSMLTRVISKYEACDNTSLVRQAQEEIQKSCGKKFDDGRVYCSTSRLKNMIKECIEVDLKN